MGKRTHPNEDQLAFDLRTKWCSRCGQDLPAWDFNRNRAQPHGLATYCRICTSSANREYSKDPARREQERARWRRWYTSDPEKHRESARAYHKANRDKIAKYRKQYHLEHGPKNNRQRRAKRRSNLDEARARDRANYYANRERHLAAVALRRVRELAAVTVPFTAEQLAARWSYYGNKCWLCRGPATATDHVKPIARGGAHMLCNLRPICKSCNSAKNATWPYRVDRKPS